MFRTCMNNMSNFTHRPNICICMFHITVSLLWQKHFASTKHIQSKVVDVIRLAKWNIYIFGSPSLKQKKLASCWTQLDQCNLSHLVYGMALCKKIDISMHKVNENFSLCFNTPAFICQTSVMFMPTDTSVCISHVAHVSHILLPDGNSNGKKRKRKTGRENIATALCD